MDQDTTARPDGTEAPASLRISDVSRLAGVPMSTLRLWEQHGLLHPSYTESGYRVFRQDDVRQALDVKRMRIMQGLSLAAIKAALRADPPAGRIAPPPAPQSAEADLKPVGTRLRELRRARGFTLREVAQRTGVDQASLTSIERTSLGLQIPLLRTLARFYGVTLTALMGEPPLATDAEVVIRAGAGKTLPTLGHGLRIEQLATGRDMMDCQRWFVEPGVHSHGSYSHVGEEIIYTLAGEFQITLHDRRTHLLRAGDSIYFKSSWRHSWRNPGSTTAVLLWVNTPPSF